MRMSDLTQKEDQVIGLIRTQTQEAEGLAYHQAMTDLSPILTWLAMDPEPTLNSLRANVLLLFEGAAHDNTAPDCTIRKHIEFYKTEFKKRGAQL